MKTDISRYVSFFQRLRGHGLGWVKTVSKPLKVFYAQKSKKAAIKKLRSIKLREAANKVEDTGK